MNEIFTRVKMVILFDIGKFKTTKDDKFEKM